MVCLLLVDSFTYPGCLRPGSSGSPAGSDSPGYLSPDHPHPGSATQLQHDAGLILSNVQILQQLVTALHGASANVMGAVRGHQPFPTQAMRHALPSGGVDRAAHYMTAMGLLRPPIAPGMRSLHAQRRLLPEDASASREAKLD